MAPLAARRVGGSNVVCLGVLMQELFLLFTFSKYPTEKGTLHGICTCNKCLRVLCRACSSSFQFDVPGAARSLDSGNTHAGLYR